MKNNLPNQNHPPPQSFSTVAEALEASDNEELLEFIELYRQLNQKDKETVVKK